MRSLSSGSAMCCGKRLATACRAVFYLSYMRESDLFDSFALFLLAVRLAFCIFKVIVVTTAVSAVCQH